MKIIETTSLFELENASVKSSILKLFGSLSRINVTPRTKLLGDVIQFPSLADAKSRIKQLLFKGFGFASDTELEAYVKNGGSLSNDNTLIVYKYKGVVYYSKLMHPDWHSNRFKDHGIFDDAAVLRNFVALT